MEAALDRLGGPGLPYQAMVAVPYLPGLDVGGLGGYHEYGRWISHPYPGEQSVL